ncbi:translation initiation factor 2A [Candida albicans SC5314]|uniref:Eukaryotic translation initiation factor 2A n=1 Tax=Candida albicans P78048 TaxID=1094989 RepID=A0AB34PZT7_CANAX|nr:translation initiation factor 2A [Candida albicans P78048]KGR23303.1 translation initiation factor 2A [Candida albicans P37037]KHC83026.1 translation initiation factor 2A [Candida albicans SC5314]KHC89952.1 translation initiation factor 2A [Candida albicans SC5314]
MSKTTEIFCRLPKSVELIQDFKDITPSPKANAECRAALYSKNGDFFAYTQPQEVVILDTTGEAKVYHRIEIPEVFDIYFSPEGTYLCLWCKPIQLNKENGTWNNNLKIFNIKTKTIIAEWSAKHQNAWKPQFTSEENLFARSINQKEIHFFELDPTSDSTVNINQPSFKYKVNDPKATLQAFQISPGRNPSVAIFIPEKSGKPANVSIYNIPNFNQPICFKNFFKAEKCQLKWNSLGTALLALASTDHDTTNKSYYGETNLYLLGIAGSYDSRIDLKREGPIHDITWSPTAREFAVSYGYMPSETTFFDSRGNAIHSLPTAPRNTILYSPHAKFVLVAGFGNLQGTVDVYDRQNKFSKVVTFEASNTSVCEWSPCGRFILTATTSPRLRVDNGCKIWHASGKLIYLKEFPELFSIGWKPQPLDCFPPIRNLEPAPEAHESTKEYLEKRQALASAAAKKPAGAYRPPHARGGGAGSGSGVASSLYQKELQNNLRSNGSTPSPPPGLSRAAGNIPRVRTVVGAPPPVEKESKAAAKNRKKREAKKQAQEKNNSPAPEATTSASPVPAQAQAPISTPAPAPATATAGVIGGVASLEEKKIRSLLKKLRAIEQLKMKQASGETLEDTQVIKISKEDEIRSELQTLGWNE